MKRLKVKFANARFFWVLVGEDPQIIEECKLQVRLRFSIIGFIVGVVVRRGAEGGQAAPRKPERRQRIQVGYRSRCDA